MTYISRAEAFPEGAMGEANIPSAESRGGEFAQTLKIVENPAMLDQIAAHDTEAKVDWNTARGIEANVFVKKGYLSSEEKHKEEYAPYEASSKFLLLQQGGPQGLPIGSLRAIYPSPAGFKTINDIEAEHLQLDKSGQEILRGIPPDQMLEAGTVCVVPELWHALDTTEASIPMYGGLVGLTRLAGVPFVIASFDEEYFGRFSRIFGPDCRALGPAVNYMGTPTLPVLIHAENVVKYAQSRLRRVGDPIANIADSIQSMR